MLALILSKCSTKESTPKGDLGRESRGLAASNCSHAVVGEQSFGLGAGHSIGVFDSVNINSDDMERL